MVLPQVKMLIGHPEQITVRNDRLAINVRHNPNDFGLAKKTDYSASWDHDGGNHWVSKRGNSRFLVHVSSLEDRNGFFP